MNGIINVYKEAGFTSFDVVAKLRGMLKTKKIGHTGTLDPDAVGVLPICIGNATKVVELLADETKEYVATMRLGIVTDTQDMSGTVLEDNTHELFNILKRQAIDEAGDRLEGSDIGEMQEIDSVACNVIMSFVGDIQQVPPMYSALKVNGQKLVDLARKGIEVERKPRPVKIYEIEILEASSEPALGENSQNGLHNIYRIRVVCSKGTYIRTLCHDIGQKLGCGAAMEHLERTRVGIFKKEDALTLDQIQKIIDDDSDGLHKCIKEVDIIFEKYKSLHVAEEGMKALNNGNQLQTSTIIEVKNNDIMLTPREVYRIYSYDNQFRALYEYHSGWKVLTPVKMFM